MDNVVTTTSLFIIVNGVPTKPFRIHMGLRQGDSISSLLFNIVVEYLNFIIHKACEKGLIVGLHVGSDRICITHLQYANDTILFLSKDDKTMVNYKRLMDSYALMTGLEINCNK